MIPASARRQSWGPGSRILSCESQMRQMRIRLTKDISRREASLPADDPPLSQGKTEESTPSQRKRFWQPLATVMVAVVISVAVFLVVSRVEPAQLQRYGYLGVLVFSLLGSATIILPTPSLAVVSVVGSVLNPFLVGIVAGAGEATGELTGYLAGYSGRAVIENRGRYEQLVAWTHKYGLWVVFLLSIIPSPLFDLAGIAAGALKIPVYRFLLVCWVGKSIKAVLFAFGGKALLLPLMNG